MGKKKGKKAKKNIEDKGKSKKAGKGKKGSKRDGFKY